MKQDKHRIFRTAVIAAIIALSASGVMAQFPYHICFAKPLAAAKTAPKIVVLSAQVTVDSEKFWTWGQSEGTAEQVKAGLQSALSEKFEEQGFKPLLDPLLMPEWESTNAIAISAVKEKFESVRKGWPNCRDLLTPSFTGELDKLASTTEFDAVLLAHADGTLRTKWRKGGNELYFEFALISRDSGQIVFYCSSPAGDGFVNAPYHSFAGPIQKCLQLWEKGKTQ
jgi:hypothetical protein